MNAMKKTTRPSRNVAPLSFREIIVGLRSDVVMYQRSYREHDGNIRDEGGLRKIAALSQAIEIIKKASQGSRGRSPSR